eukprot:gene4969-977_t
MRATKNIFDKWKEDPSQPFVTNKVVDSCRPLVPSGLYLLEQLSRGDAAHDAGSR